MPSRYERRTRWFENCDYMEKPQKTPGQALEELRETMEQLLKQLEKWKPEDIVTVASQTLDEPKRD